MGKQMAVPEAMDKNQSWEESEGIIYLSLLDNFKFKFFSSNNSMSDQDGEDNQRVQNKLCS